MAEGPWLRFAVRSRTVGIHLVKARYARLPTRRRHHSQGQPPVDQHRSPATYWNDEHSAKENARAWLGAAPGLQPDIARILAACRDIGPVRRWCAEPETHIRIVVHSSPGDAGPTYAGNRTPSPFTVGADAGTQVGFWMVPRGRADGGAVHWARCRFGSAGQHGDGPGGAGGAVRRDGRPRVDEQHELEDGGGAGRMVRRDDRCRRPGQPSGSRGQRTQRSDPVFPGDLSNLRELSLWSNALSGAIPSSLGNLSNLEWLSLDRNALSGAIPSSLGNLSNLRTLWIGRNALSGAIPSSLGNLSNLVWLWLADNALSGAIPSSLGYPVQSQRAESQVELGVVRTASVRLAAGASHESGALGDPSVCAGRLADVAGID